MDPFSAGYQAEKFQTKLQRHRSPTQSTGSKHPPGTLIISDTFQPRQDGGMPHGHLVARAARDKGFGGLLHADQVGRPGASYKAALDALLRLETDAPKSREEIINSISAFTVGNTVGLLDRNSRGAQLATESGAKNTVLNISQGTSKATAVRLLYEQAQDAWNPGSSPYQKRGGLNLLNNYAKAYDLDLEKLKNPKPEIAEPERNKLHQKLIHHVHHDFENSSAIAQSKKRWASSAKNFEARNNSLVIAAGNDALERAPMTEFNGETVSTPPDYDRNILETPEITSVGATSRNEGRISVADYSSGGAKKSIYAHGGVDWNRDGEEDASGTSLAAPRVAQAMATLHQMNPKLTSSQVEALLHSRMTREHTTDSGAVIRVLK
jgi:hypothetical protein